MREIARGTEREDLVEFLVVDRLEQRAQDQHVGPIGGRPLPFEAAPREHLRAFGRMREPLLRDAGLADPGLSREHDDPAGAAHGRVERIVEARECRSAPDEVAARGARRGRDRSAGQLGRDLLVLGHGRDEAVAAPVHGLDDLLLDAIVTDRSPGRGDAARQRRLADRATVPEPIEELVLRHDAIAPLEQEEQRVEYLRLDLDHATGPTQLVQVVVEHAIAEHPVHHAMIPAIGEPE